MKCIRERLCACFTNRYQQSTRTIISGACAHLCFVYQKQLMCVKAVHHLIPLNGSSLILFVCGWWVNLRAEWQDPCVPCPVGGGVIRVNEHPSAGLLGGRKGWCECACAWARASLGRMGRNHFWPERLVGSVPAEHASLIDRSEANGCFDYPKYSANSAHRVSIQSRLSVHRHTLTYRTAADSTE